jgi:hypothetical protein
MSKKPANPERSFGISVGTVLLLIAAALLWRGRATRAEVLGAVGALLLLFGFLQPALLKWPSALWRRFAIALGYVNARIILTVVFALLLIPLGLVWRMLGRDPLHRRRPAAGASGWFAYSDRYRDPQHYKRMF